MVPELPEVETVRRGLQQLVLGFKIKEVDEFHPRVRKISSLSTIKAVEGARIVNVNRRGKFLWFELDRPEVLVAHLGMSGQFLIARRQGPHPKHVRAAFHLSRGFKSRTLNFNDQRTFGWLSVEGMKDGVPTSAEHIALDPFDAKFDRASVVKNFARRNMPIKSALLNQAIMSGVGNIYADETLWRAKVHPETLANSLSPRQIGKVVDRSVEVMGEAIDKGGTSFDDMYINVNGESGFFEVALSAYGRTGQPCPRCGTPIERIVIGQRSSHFCPLCQR